MASKLKQRGDSPALTRDVTSRLNDLAQIEVGGESTAMLLRARAKKGFLCFRNSYWFETLFTLRGRAVPWLALIIYIAYTALVCGIGSLVESPEKIEQLKQLNSVTTSIGVALFLLLTFRNNVAYTRWQTGMDRFRCFCNKAKFVSAAIADNLPLYLEVAGADGYDLVRERLNWMLAAMEASRQFLRREKDEHRLLDILTPDEIKDLSTAPDPVLYCLHRMQAVDGKYMVHRCQDWAKYLELMYLEFCGCVAVYSTPIPFAYISHLRTFLVLWLACVPWVYVIYYQWYTLVLSFIIGYGIIGVEEAAVEVEQPFGRDFNDLPLDSIVAAAYRDVAVYARLVNEAERGGHDDMAPSRVDAPDDATADQDKWADRASQLPATDVAMDNISMV